MRRHLLVTNDFPPKVGGIQSYLWELWRRLPPGRVTVLTTPYAGSRAFDAAAPMEVVRSRQPVLLPHPGVTRWVRREAERVGAELIVLDPALPLGAIGPSLGLPYAAVIHGAEVAVPGRLPVTSSLLGRVLRGAELVVAGGAYSLHEAERAAGGALPTVTVPPGVDLARFRPRTDDERLEIRERMGLDPDAVLVHAGSRLVPRKGIDMALRAVGQLSRRRRLQAVVTGTGRDRRRLELIALDRKVPARFLGRVPDAVLSEVAAAADVFAMLCRTRWGGLEQEGFGIVFLEAAASGVPQVAGRSGGAHEAVADGVSGLVVDHPGDQGSVTAALARLIDDEELRRRLASGSRRHAQAFSYDRLATRLEAALT